MEEICIYFIWQDHAIDKKIFTKLSYLPSIGDMVELDFDPAYRYQSYNIINRYFDYTEQTRKKNDCDLTVSIYLERR